MNKLIDLGKSLLKKITDNLTLDIQKDENGVNMEAKLDKTNVTVSKQGEDPVKVNIKHGQNNEPGE